MLTVLLDTSAELEDCEREIGTTVGQLLTPLTGFRNRAVEEGRPFACDNGCFSEFKEDSYWRMIEKNAKHGPQFITVPDVVGSAIRTIELFFHFAPKMKGLPLAFVAQDGQEYLPIPWDMISAIFIGGTDVFKQSEAAKQILATAKILKKHKHVGRVNDPNRARWCYDNAVDTIDGSGLAMYSHMRRNLMAFQYQPMMDFS